MEKGTGSAGSESRMYAMKISGSTKGPVISYLQTDKDGGSRTSVSREELPSSARQFFGEMAKELLLDHAVFDPKTRKGYCMIGNVRVMDYLPEPVIAETETETPKYSRDLDKNAFHLLGVGGVLATIRTRRYDWHERGWTDEKIAAIDKMASEKSLSGAETFAKTLASYGKTILLGDKTVPRTETGGYGRHG